MAEATWVDAAIAAGYTPSTTDDDTGEPWSAERWQEALAEEAEEWLKECRAPSVATMPMGA